VYLLDAMLIVVEDQLKVFVNEESSVAKPNALKQNNSTEKLLEIVKKLCETGPKMKAISTIQLVKP
jgi:hypothetical protein